MHRAGGNHRSVTTVVLIGFFLNVAAEEAAQKADILQSPDATARPAVTAQGETSSPVVPADDAPVEPVTTGSPGLSPSLPPEIDQAAVGTDAVAAGTPDSTPIAPAAAKLAVPVPAPGTTTIENTGAQNNNEPDPAGIPDQMEPVVEPPVGDTELTETNSGGPGMEISPPTEQAGDLAEDAPGGGVPVDGSAVELAPFPEVSALQEVEPPDENFHILGAIVAPGVSTRLHWLAGESFYGDTLNTPIHIIHGAKPGMTLCLTAGIHGDELNGVEIVLNLMDSIRARDLSGTIIGVPVVNLLGFTRGTRYLPDRRDLNRYFPGNPRGSAAARIAHSFFEAIIRHCDRLVDLHTGSLKRTNLPQLRADLDNTQVLEFTRHFGATAVLHSRNIRGNLRSAALRAGIPSVTFELGEPGSMQEEHIEFGIKAIETLLDKLDMVQRRRSWSEPQPVYYGSRWVRVNNGGLLRSTVKVGAKVKQGARLGTVANPLTGDVNDILSPYNGRVLGMALNQFMLPGYAAFHIGIVADETELYLEPPLPDCRDWENPNQMFEEEGDCDGELSEEDGQENNLEESLPYIPEDEQVDEIDLL